MAAQLLDTTKDRWLESDPKVIRDQVGMRNILAISGGRMIASATGGLILPVSSGYKVTIDLAPGDTWTVRRVLVRGTKTFLKGEMTGIYPEILSEIAYQASCFHNGPFGE